METITTMTNKIQSQKIAFQVAPIANEDLPQAGKLTPPEWFSAPSDSPMTDRQWKRLCDQFRYEFSQDGYIYLQFKGMSVGCMHIESEIIEMGSSLMRSQINAALPFGHSVSDWGKLKPVPTGYEMRVHFKGEKVGKTRTEYTHVYYISTRDLYTLTLGRLPKGFAFTNPRSRNVQKAFALNEVLSHDIHGDSCRRAARVALRRALNYVYWKMFNADNTPEKGGKGQEPKLPTNHQAPETQKPAKAGLGGAGYSQELRRKSRRQSALKNQIELATV